jgi:BirA family biotin operon repressor/biotin-[acetyl-CoA-carboxylase] ligase
MSGDKNIFNIRTSDGNTIKFEYRDSLPSVASLAKKYALAGYPDRYVIFAEKQTALSALGTPLSSGESENGIFLSCILRPSIFLSQAGVIGPLSALACILALEEYTAKDLGLGWTSDLYCEGNKIGGVTMEAKPDSPTSFEYIIVTFAIKLDEKNFPRRLTDMVRQVFEENNLSVPMIMAKTILNKFFLLYSDLKNPEKHLATYASKFALADKKVTYINNGKKRSARIIELNKNDMTLCIETRDGKRINVSSPSTVIIPNKL